MARTHDYRRETLAFGHEIRAFEAIAPGRYRVEGVGPGVEVGDRIRFTLKGSSALELVLEVESIRHRIIPQDAWSAVLVGQDFTVLEILVWSVLCDACGARLQFEFAAPEGAASQARVEAATDRIRALGWSAGPDGHRCAGCGGGPSGTGS